MKNWKTTSVIALLAIITAAVAYLYGREENNNPVNASINSLDFLPEVVATYGDKKITRDDFSAILNEITASIPNANQQLNPQLIRSLAPKIINGIIEKKVLLELAEADGIKPSKELVLNEFSEMIKNMPEDKLNEFKNYLDTQGKTIEDYNKELSEKKLIQEEVAIGNWIKTKIKPSINVSDEEAKKYYDEHPEAFTKEESVTASHILVKSKSESDADFEEAKKKTIEIKEKITKGEISFEKAAEEFSDCPSGKEAKGNLGEFTRGDMIKEFEDAAFELKEGELSDPVKTIHGYHIIKVTSHKDKVITPYTEVKAKIIEYLQDEQTDKKLRELLDKKKAELNIKILVPEEQPLPPVAPIN